METHSDLGTEVAVRVHEALVELPLESRFEEIPRIVAKHYGPLTQPVGFFNTHHFRLTDLLPYYGTVMVGLHSGLTIEQFKAVYGMSPDEFAELADMGAIFPILRFPDEEYDNNVYGRILSRPRVRHSDTNLWTTIAHFGNDPSETIDWMHHQLNNPRL